MGGRFIEVTPAVNSRDLLRILRNVKKGDIIFIDEVHKLKTEIIESMLYPAMEDFELHYTESNSQHTNSKTQKIEPFTLIGATTETGKLLKPFYSKFPINVTLCEYKLETIATIIKNSFRVRGINISDELCFEVANRSRLSPRMANAHVEGIASSAIVKAAEQKNIEGRGALNSKEAIEALHITITKDDVLNYFNKLGIDERGLKEDERKILRVLIEMYNGGPTGQENIAKALNIATNRVDQEYEPYLVKLGFINIRPQGRYATEAAYEYLGIKNENAKANESKTDEVQDDNGTQDDNQKQADSKNEIIEDDELPVIECAIGEFDQKSADRFIELFSGEGEQSDKSLDELFPDVDKTYDSIAANRCVLKVGSRELYCDSKLERRFISYLFKKGFITDAKSEALELEYSSDSMSGKRYFPDFVLKLYDGRIAVVELKNLSSVGYHLNIAKYEALKSYCAENGYLYAEVAKDYESDRYVSAEQLKAKEVNNELKKFVYDKIENNGICTAEDLKNGMFANVDIVNLLLNDRSLKNIDRTGAHPQIVGTSE
jgi:Holliday junction DNA helicase RuvB